MNSSPTLKIPRLGNPSVDALMTIATSVTSWVSIVALSMTELESRIPASEVLNLNSVDVLVTLVINTLGSLVRAAKLAGETPKYTSTDSYRK